MESGIFILFIFQCPEQAVEFFCIIKDPRFLPCWTPLVWCVNKQFLPAGWCFIRSHILVPPRHWVCPSAPGVNGMVLPIWYDQKGGLKPLLCMWVSGWMYISPAALDHHGQILPWEIYIFRARVFLQNVHTSYWTATIGHWHLSGNKSCSFMAADILNGADPGGPRRIPGATRTLSAREETGPCREGYEGCAAILFVLPQNVTFTYLGYVCTD